jgi:hypothetical protein
MMPTEQIQLSNLASDRTDANAKFFTSECQAEQNQVSNLASDRCKVYSAETHPHANPFPGHENFGDACIKETIHQTFYMTKPMCLRICNLGKNPSIESIM